MPRRAPAPPAQMAPPQPPSWLIPHIQKVPEQLAILRTNWKWAAFSQFFFTFNPLFNMDDVNLAVRAPIQHICEAYSYDPAPLAGH